jgi:ATP-dependent Lhr-like helicase
MLRTASVTQIALFVGEHAEAWPPAAEDGEPGEAGITDDARAVLDRLRARGASFFKELMAAVPFDGDRLRQALSVLVAAGLVTSDGFAGLRMLVAASQGRVLPDDRRINLAGRWSVRERDRENAARDGAVELQAWTLLRRYGVVFRRLLTRETVAARRD